jgi:hypothetical protein
MRSMPSMNTSCGATEAFTARASAQSEAPRMLSTSIAPAARLRP